MTEQKHTSQRSRHAIVTVTGLALFAMYFGAGNLIFPVMIGVNAGSNTPLAVAGFLITGVLLPVLGMVAVASRSHEPGMLADNIGKLPGLLFTVVIFLSTGMLYAIPRVATVGYEMAVKPALSASVEEGSAAVRLGLPIFTVVFFALVYALTINPRQLLNRIGLWLSPALIVLLLLLIGAMFMNFHDTVVTPSPEYASNPLETGLIQGYFTMDAIASLVFGIVIIDSLRRAGMRSKKSLASGTIGAGIVAGATLAIIYIGLSVIGLWIAPQGPTNGAQALAMTTEAFFGRAGQLIFGLIALLACLTTAVGLVGASSQYFRTLFTSISHRTVVIVHVVVALLLANMGLEFILRIVAPINQLIYPIVVAIIAVALINMTIPGKLYWSYRLTAWVAAFVGVFEAARSIGLDIFAPLEFYLNTLPLGVVNLPWVTPALAALVVGLVIDFLQGRFRAISSENLAVDE